MKFGKRLSTEAERQWREHYIDYKACKRAIQEGVQARDPAGHAFDAAIRAELEKVSGFYARQEAELERAMQQVGGAGAPPEGAAALGARVKGLRKYVVLNYVAVVKACKKRNRHLKAVCGEAVAAVRAVDILAHQHFFTSPKLAALATQAEILAKALQPVTETLLEDYQCAICLGLIRGAVVLTCAHRFCWGCLVAHCTTVLGRQQQEQQALLLQAGEGKQGGGKEAGANSSSSSGGAVMVPSWEGEHSDDEQTLATFDCPVCRKAQLLDLDRLQVDPHLDAFLRKLEQQQQMSVEASSGDHGAPASAAAADEMDVEVAARAAAPQPCASAGTDAEAEPMAVDALAEAATAAAAGSTTPAARSAPGVAPTSGEGPLLKVETMDAVVAYLHEEHRLQQEERRLREQRTQQEQQREKQQDEVRPAPLQRTASQPMAIATGSRASVMEVEPSAPSARSSLLEDACAGASPPSSPLAAPRPAAGAAAPARPPLAEPATRKRVEFAAEVVVEQQRAPASGEPPLLPPPRPEHQGKLVVCLDLDGTLVSTFTPKRAPALPPGGVGYVVGKGGKLNPGGVFVVERPGLREFFRRITPIAEVVLFTAGLEDYAKPICDALEAKYGCFHHRLYRPACVPDEVYPCIKDMSRLGRDLKRTLLVDDTPLAFFRQPDNGIPVLQFRGDVDDQLLTEAVAPLIESLAGVQDVPAALSRRFQMGRWFAAQGLQVAKPAPAHAMHRAPSAPLLHTCPTAPPQHQSQQAAPSSNEVLRQQRSRGVLLVCDFDKTLINYDAGERLCDELAPELTSLLSSLEMPANFVPVTNTVLAEMQRRGVSRDKILSTLRAMGQEVPLASVRMLQWASRAGIDVRVLSDCNSTVIHNVLLGAKVNNCVREVITNLSAFQRVEDTLAAAGAGAQEGQCSASPRSAGGWLQRAFGSGGGSDNDAALACRPRAASQRLVITPRHNYTEAHHGCPLCPANLCKGQELEGLWASGPRPQRTIYAGDGQNDLCPVLCLGPDDVVLARKGHPLEALIRKRADAPEGIRRVVAQVHTWSTHEELWQLVQDAACI